MKLKILLTGLSIMIVALFSFTSRPCDIENQAFSGGEKLTYKIYYNWGYLWLSAGEVQFQVIDQGDTYLLESVGKTYASYEWFFKVDDYFKSIVDKKTLQPVEFERIVREGNYRYYNRIEFDPSGKSAFSYVGKTKQDAVVYEVDLKDCTNDILTTIYALRNESTHGKTPGDLIPLDLFFDNASYPVNVEYAGVETKKIKNLGTYDVIKLKPGTVAGTVFKEGQKMAIWVSNDQNKLPLQIESPVSVGSVKAILQSYNGLRYPLQKK